MTAMLQQLKTQLDQLTAEERAELADYLLQGLDTAEDVQVAWIAEARRRMNDIKSGNVHGKPADVVMARLREQFP